MPGRGNLAPLYTIENLIDVGTPNGRLTGQQAIERRSQAIHIALRSQLVEPARRLFRTHERRRADRRTRQCLRRSARRRRPQRTLHSTLTRTHHLGQAPVDHQRLAILTHHDVPGLDVPMQHPPAVRVPDRVTHVQKPPQQLLKRQHPLTGDRGSWSAVVEPRDRLPQAVSLDKPHRVKRPAKLVVAQTVHRHDPRMLESSRDLRLQQEPRPALRMARVPVLNLLERHLAVQLGVFGHKHLAQAPSRMKLQDPKPRPRRAGCADMRLGRVRIRFHARRP